MPLHERHGPVAPGTDQIRSAAGRRRIARLREALGPAGYTSHGIADRIGPAAVAAVRRNDFRALLRATTRAATRWPR